VPSSDRLHSGASATTIGQLVADAPLDAFKEIDPKTWRLMKPLGLGVGNHVSLTGPLTIEIANGAFILAEHDSSLRLDDVTVTGVRADGSPQRTPVVGRGFIDARSGAVLTLEHDTFEHLGYLGDQTYGVTIDGGSGASTLLHDSVTSDYFGVYIGRANGVTVSDSRFANSVIYGIDPHTDDTHLTITNNTVVGSGVHGIVVASHVTDSLVANNEVLNSRDHGIVLFQFADHNVVRDNQVTGVFDGLVITDSSNNQVTANVISTAQRFGVRISGSSSGNVLSHNTISKCLLGAYLYNGASSNQLTSNHFSDNYENVRVRSDAPNNTVSPDPGRSEV
jgi:parallel beta-helix repeat protein